MNEKPHLLFPVFFDCFCLENESSMMWRTIRHTKTGRRVNSWWLTIGILAMLLCVFLIVSHHRGPVNRRKQWVYAWPRVEFDPPVAVEGRALRPSEYSKQVSQVAQLLVAGTFDIKTNNLGVLYWRESKEERENYLLLGANMSWQRAFDSVRASLSEGVGYRAGEHNVHRPPSESIPVYGALVTAVDFPLLINHLTCVDVGVGKFVFVVNGKCFLCGLFIDALQFVFHGGQISSFYNDVNIGVAAAWNTVMREGFTNWEDKGLHHRAEYVMIVNADITPLPHQLKGFARATFNNRKGFIVNRFADFAAMAITELGMDELGYFDENIFPAYGEDVEYHLRAVSKGMGLQSKHFGKTGNEDMYWHYTSPNRKRNTEFAQMIDRFDVKDYISKKWGILLGSVKDYQFCTPFAYPFNIETMNHTSWRIDPDLRKCITDFAAPGPCKFNLDVIQKG